MLKCNILGCRLWYILYQNTSRQSLPIISLKKLFKAFVGNDHIIKTLQAKPATVMLEACMSQSSMQLSTTRPEQPPRAHQLHSARGTTCTHAVDNLSPLARQEQSQTRALFVHRSFLLFLLPNNYRECFAWDHVIQLMLLAYLSVLLAIDSSHLPYAVAIVKFTILGEEIRMECWVQIGIDAVT